MECRSTQYLGFQLGLCLLLHLLPVFSKLHFHRRPPLSFLPQDLVLFINHLHLLHCTQQEQTNLNKLWGWTYNLSICLSVSITPSCCLSVLSHNLSVRLSVFVWLENVGHSVILLFKLDIMWGKTFFLIPLYQLLNELCLNETSGQKVKFTDRLSVIRHVWSLWVSVTNSWLKPMTD